LTVTAINHAVLTKGENV